MSLGRQGLSVGFLCGATGSFLAKALPAWLKSQRLLTEKAVKDVCHSKGMVRDRLDFFRLMKRLRNASRWQRKTGKPW